MSDRAWHEALGRFRSCDCCGSPWGELAGPCSTWEHLCQHCAREWGRYVRLTALPGQFTAELELSSLPEQAEEAS